MRKTKKENKALCEKYPFLTPSNRWSGKRITEGKGFWPKEPESIPEYDWEYTELDEMPDGWRIAFGEQMCEELKTELERIGFLYDYRIVQIKEKYGCLRWYDNGISREGHKIIGKYEEISKGICICCGKPATRITLGWISPFCDDCVPEDERTVPIEKYYSKDNEDPI